VLVGSADGNQQSQKLVPLGFRQDTEHAPGALTPCGIEPVEQAPARLGQFHEYRAAVLRVGAACDDSGGLRAVDYVGNRPRNYGETLGDDGHPQWPIGEQPNEPSLRAGKPEGRQRFPGSAMQSASSPAEQFGQLGRRFD
jgi:hypothetical protein